MQNNDISQACVQKSLTIRKCVWVDAYVRIYWKDVRKL